MSLHICDPPVPILKGLLNNLEGGHLSPRRSLSGLHVNHPSETGISLSPGTKLNCEPKLRGVRDRKRTRSPRPASQELSLILSKQIILGANTVREKGLPVLLACVCVWGRWLGGRQQKEEEGRLVPDGL